MFALNCNYKEILLDEIALEGLEGVTLSNLWIHVAQRLALSSPISDSLQNKFWDTLITFDCLSFYTLPEDVPDIRLCDRFSYIDPNKGVLYEPEDPINEFELYPTIPNEYGLCKYKNRSKVSREVIESMSREEVVEKWSKRLVIVATLEARWQALAGHISITYLRFLQPVHYILLELIGKSRKNGQTTVGRNALCKVTPNSKLLFYQRILLIELGLVMKYRITLCLHLDGPVQQGILLRLVRYHQGHLIPPPNVGLLYNAIEILKRKPGQRELISKLREQLGLSCKQFQKLYKRVDVQKYLKIDETVDKPTTKSGYTNQAIRRKRKPSGSDGEEESKAKAAKLALPPRYVTLRTEEEQAQSSESEDEESKDSSSYMKTDYRLGVPLLRQALQKIRNAGEYGLTQINLSKVLGTDPYATRGLCRQLTSSKCVEEFLEDKGRQRTTRYICRKQSVDANVSVQYEKEKDKLISHMEETQTSLKRKRNKQPTKGSDNVRVSEFNSFQCNLNDITEVTQFTGIRDNASSFIATLKTSKNLTSLKQLKLANCILNVVKEKPIVAGFDGLKASIKNSGHFESIDSKSLKRCALRLADDGQLRMYKVKWPTIKQYTTLVCAPGISKEDPLISSIYNDICLRSFRSKVPSSTHPSSNMINDICKYPKYMRARLLHETLFSFVYGDDLKNNKTNLPEGWISLINVLPHLSFGLVMSHLTFITEKLITYLKDRTILEKKINTLPIEVCQALFETNKTIMSIKRTVKCLGTLGLLQFTEKAYSTLYHSEGSKHLDIFVNRHATLVNTNGTINHEQNNLPRAKTSFYFETCNELKDYWKCFQEIALHTVVELENRTVLECTGKVAAFEEAAGQDDGSVPGDGLGVAGYHSAYFIELLRQWAVQDKVPIKRKLAELRAKPPMGYCPQKRPCLPRRTEQVKKVGKKMVRLKKNSKQLMAVKPKAEVARPKKPMTRTKLRWLPWEDDLIIMARTARSILTGGNNSMGASMCAKISKCILKTINKDSNKTVMICHRHGVKLDRSLIYASEREKYLAEVQRRPSLRMQYEGMYQRLKTQYKDEVKFSNAIDLKIAELLLAIMRLPTCNSGKHCVEAASKSIRELKEKYYIRKSQRENVMPYGKEDDILVNMLMDAVHMILYFNPKYKSPQEIFDVFIRYEEITLRAATNNLYEMKLIAKTKKADNTTKLIDESAKLCYDFHYRLSHKYKVLMLDRLPQKQFDDMIAPLATTESNATSLSSAIFNCALFELLPSESASLCMNLKNALSNEVSTVDKTSFDKIAICEVEWHLKGELADISTAVNEEALKHTLKEMERKSMFPNLAPTQSNIENEQLAFVLTEKEERGATMDDLLQKCSGTITLPTLKEYLKDLEDKSIIVNVGLDEPKWVLSKFSQNWLLQVGEMRLKPKPWLNIDGTLNKEAFVKISHTVLLRTVEIPGLSVYGLAEWFKFLRVAHVREVCELLENFGCVTIKRLISRESNVFDDDYEEEDICFEEPCFTNHPKTLYVFPTYNAITLFSIVRSVIKKL